MSDNSYQMTRNDHYRERALDMAIRHIGVAPDMVLRDPESITKTAELFRRFLSGETWATM